MSCGSEQWSEQRKGQLYRGLAHVFLTLGKFQLGSASDTHVNCCPHKPILITSTIGSDRPATEAGKSEGKKKEDRKRLVAHNPEVK